MLGENEVTVPVNGGSEVTVVWVGDGEVWAEEDGFWVGPMECCGLGPYIYWVICTCCLRNEVKE